MMAEHTDAMRQFIQLSESVDKQPVKKAPVIIDTDFDLHESSDTRIDEMLEDLTKLLFKLQSRRLDEGSNAYVRGQEEGIAVAATLISGLIDQYKSLLD